MFFLLSNLAQYFVESRNGHISRKLVFIFGIYTPYVAGQDQFTRHELNTLLTFIVIIVPVVLIINVVVQAVVRRCRPLKTLISFYLPLSLVPSPLLTSWLNFGYFNATSVSYLFMVLAYTSLAMIYAWSTLGRVSKINSSETGVYVCVSWWF